MLPTRTAREIARAIVAVDRALATLPVRPLPFERHAHDVVCLQGCRISLVDRLRRHGLELVGEGSILCRPIEAPLPAAGGGG